MNQLQIVRDDIEYQLAADGTLTASIREQLLNGTWTAQSAQERNELTLSIPDREPVIVPVTYSFVTDSDLKYENLLRIEVPAEGEGQKRQSHFTGFIRIDDHKDIEYVTLAGQTFILYGSLDFSDAFTRLNIDLKDGGKTSISGILELSQNNTIFDNERDLLSFFCWTKWSDANNIQDQRLASIKLSGHFDLKDRQVVFVGSVQNERTFDITLGARYKFINGGIRIYSDEAGDIAGELQLRGDLNFKKVTGQFGLNLGYSKSQDLSIDFGANLNFDHNRTDGSGLTRLQGTTELHYEDGKLDIDVDLQGTFNSRHGMLVFELEAGFSDNKLEVAASGTLTFKDGQLSFKVGYRESQAFVQLALERDRLQTVVKAIYGPDGFSVDWSITFTFGSEEDEEPQRRFVTADESTSSETPKTIPPVSSPPTIAEEITPETYAKYPRPGRGKSNDFSLLHPVLRRLVIRLQIRLHEEGIPLFVFEGFRSPTRQNELYEERPRRTNAMAWQSYHQYGVAVDFVFYEQGKWHWGETEQHKAWYKILHAYARELGLEPLSWEMPHLQLAGVDLRDLQRGNYPAEGDSSWGTHLTEVIQEWNEQNNEPAAPPAPSDFVDLERPPLNAEQQQRRLLSPDELDGAGAFHSRFDGIEWKVDVTGDVRGVIVRGQRKPVRTDGEPITCRKIYALYGELIAQAALRFDVPEELIVMIIATESSAYRSVAYTGPRTFRWESHIGEYSAGPMQLLSSTVRELIERYGLPYRPLDVAPRFNREPTPIPIQHPLYDPELNILLGALYIKDHLDVTGYDPVLVSATYNAGGLYPSEANRWHLRSYGNHLDRAARWFGDVFSV